MHSTNLLLTPLSGVHGICIKHAGRAEARMLAFNRFELEEWIEALRSAAGTPSHCTNADGV